MAIDGREDGRKLTSGPGGINEGSSANELLIRSRVRGDPFDRYQLTADGTQYVGDGTVRPDRVATTALWVPAAAFTPALLTPVLSIVNVNMAAYLLDDSTTEQIGAAVAVPEEWATVDMDVWWARVGATAGDVRFKGIIGSATSGAAPTGGTATPLTDVAAGSQYAVVVSTLTAPAIAVDPSKVILVAVQRVGSSANDTLTGDAAVYGVMLRQAS